MQCLSIRSRGNFNYIVLEAKMLPNKIIAAILILFFGVVSAMKENESTIIEVSSYYNYDDDNVTSFPYNSTYYNGNASMEKNVTSNKDISINQDKDFHYQLFVLTFYSQVAIFIPGHILVCIVILNYKNMQNSPNVYVFSIAIADMVASWIQFLYVIYPTDKLNVNITNVVSVLKLTSNSVTVWTTVGITIDRYMALCHPFRARTYFTVSKALKINISIWILLLINSCFELICQNGKGTEGLFMAVLNIIYFQNSKVILFFLLPLFIITVLYMGIIQSIWKSSKLKKCCHVKGHSMTGRSLQISVAVVVQFILCWGLFYGYELQLKLIKFLIGSDDVTIWDYMIKLISFSCGNFDPIVYAVVSKQFRKYFKSILCLDCDRRK